MTKYKVTKVFIFEAPSKTEAMARVAASTTDEVLEYISVVEQPQAREKGWFGAVKEQVVGK